MSCRMRAPKFHTEDTEGFLIFKWTRSLHHLRVVFGGLINTAPFSSDFRKPVTVDMILTVVVSLSY